MVLSVTLGRTERRISRPDPTDQHLGSGHGFCSPLTAGPACRFPGHRQRLAAGGQHVQLRAGGQERLHQPGDSGQQVLVVVQDQQDPPVAQVKHHSGVRRLDTGAPPAAVIGRPGSRTASTEPTPTATSPGSRSGASSTSHAPSGNSPCTARPSSIARRVLPTPGGPERVNSRDSRTNLRTSGSPGPAAACLPTATTPTSSSWTPTRWSTSPCWPIPRTSSGRGRPAAGSRPTLGPDRARLVTKRTHNCALRERLTLTATVERDPGKRRFAQRFPVVPW